MSYIHTLPTHLKKFVDTAYADIYDYLPEPERIIALLVWENIDDYLFQNFHGITQHIFVKSCERLKIFFLDYVDKNIFENINNIQAVGTEFICPDAPMSWVKKTEYSSYVCAVAVSTGILLGTLHKKPKEKPFIRPGDKTEYSQLAR